MFKSHALFAEAGDGDGTGGGAPDGGSPEGGQGNQPDEGEKAKFESRLRAALASQEAKLRTEFEARLAEATAKKPDPPKRYTRQELKAAVEAGQISETQADEILENQIRDEVTATARNEARAVVTSASREGRVESDIARYKAVAPEILDTGHETRHRLRESYNYFLSLGDKPGTATELKALHAVLGPIEKLERARSGRFSSDSHRETGGGEAGKPRTKSGKLTDRLNADAKRHYEKQIEKGLYKDWGDVETELKYASPRIRQNLGIA